MAKEVDAGVALVALDSLLKDSYFAWFSFSTSFALRFERVASKLEVPRSMILRLVCPWWCGEREAWLHRVAEIGPNDLSDPEEAVQAFDLVRLRWSSDASIKEVCFDGKTLSLVFSNGFSIHAQPEELDESWDLVEDIDNPDDGDWAVTCEGRQIFLRRPR